MKAVLPNLDGLHSQVKSALENTAESELRADAIKVHEALLVRPTYTHALRILREGRYSRCWHIQHLHFLIDCSRDNAPEWQ